MNDLTIVLSIISSIGVITSILFTYLSFKRNNLKDKSKEGKNEGIVMSDIGYIKACLERVEKNLNKVDDRYRSIGERIARVEESVSNITKRIDEM